MLAKIVGDSIKRVNLKKLDHQPVANTAAVATLTAVAGKQHAIHGIQWSYSTSPTGGKLTITEGGVTVWEVDVVSGGPGGFNFTVAAATNTEVVVTLAAGSGACLGKVNVQYTTEPALAD